MKAYSNMSIEIEVLFSAGVDFKSTYYKLLPLTGI